MFQAARTACENSLISTDDNDQLRLISAIKNNLAEEVETLAVKGTNIALKTDQGDNLLHLAVRCESYDVVETLIKLGLNPNRPNAKGDTPMWTAVEHGNSTVMEILRENGANIKGKHPFIQDTLLHFACRLGNADAVSWLLTSGAEVNVRNSRKETPLLVASAKGHGIIVHSLLSAGANVNCRYGLGDTPLHVAAGFGHLTVVQYLIKFGAHVNSVSLTGMTPLHKAAEGGNDLIVQQLLDQGAKIDESKTTLGLAPLHMGAFDFHTAKTLIERGADINVTTFNGAKPIHWVAYGTSLNQSDVTVLLLENGAFPNDVMVSGWTPLHLGALYGSPRLVEKLITNGVDVEARDAAGRTPLHYATVRNSQALVRQLIASGAPLDVMDQDGETAFMWAENRGLTDIATILKRKYLTI